jgi:predicted negative regulator of RcsB-dependent stress response
MATQLDLEEQEQLEQLKAFWSAYGNLITTVLVLVVGAYLAWLGWNAWQRDQGAKAGSMYDELDRAVQAGDASRANSIFGDMKDRYPRTTFTGQAGLLAAKVAADKGQLDVARTDLAWVADSASESAYRVIARLRISGLLLDEKKYDEALKQLDGIDEAEFAGLVADRRGDILAAAGKIDEARAAYQKAVAAMDNKVDYRRVVEAKLNVLGTTTSAVAPTSSASAAKK